MPGKTNTLGDTVNETLKTLLPDLCIGIGQARGYNKITFERMAKNLRYFVTLDKAGNAPKGTLIIKDAPAAYWNSFPNQENLVCRLG
ncbi:hypothetical protein [Calothrix sp. CCY 0018]|uniref:pyroglutamyl-peptidase I family protein n=1 Tax=Calothrix sp. CCY 0018 TaxID=3103864 RepID=UPI0039C6BF2B